MKHFFAAMFVSALVACVQGPDRLAPAGTQAIDESPATKCSQQSVIVYFEPWSSTISPAARQALNFLQEQNEACCPERLDVYAYGDVEGSAEENAQITEARASAVRDELVRMGARPAQVNLKPQGQKGAMREDGTPRPAHRYAEIVVIQ